VIRNSLEKKCTFENQGIKNTFGDKKRKNLLLNNDLCNAARVLAHDPGRDLDQQVRVV